MKKIITIICYATFLFIGKTSAQKVEKPSTDGITSFCTFAKIVDKDGYVNVREKANAKSKIIGTIKSSEVVYIFEDLNTEWLDVQYKNENKDKSQYIHRSRLKYINTFEMIPATIYEDKEATFILRDIRVDIKVKKFNYELNKKYFTEIKHKDGFILRKYRGKEMWGTDGTIPKNYYQSIIVTLGNKKIEIPQKDIEDLFNATNEYAECYYDNTDNSLYLHLANSDGSGSYVVLFKFVNGIYMGRQTEIPF